MDERERWEQNETAHGGFDDRLKSLETRMAAHDIQYAVISTKLTAILWGIGVTGTALIGVLVKMIFGA